MLLESWLFTVLLGEALGAWAAMHGRMLSMEDGGFTDVPDVCTWKSHKASVWIAAPHRVGLSPQKKCLEHRQPDK